MYPRADGPDGWRRARINIGAQVLAVRRIGQRVLNRLTGAGVDRDPTGPHAVDHGQASSPNIPSKVRQRPARPAGKIAYALEALTVIHKHSPFGVIFCGYLFIWRPLLHCFPECRVDHSGCSSTASRLGSVQAYCSAGRAERAQLVIAVSRHTRRLFLSWANCGAEMVRVLPNTVDERFTPGAKPDALLDRYKLRGKKMLLTVSRLAATERYMGHDRVMRAVANLRATLPDIVYVVADDGDDRSRLEQQSRDLGIADRVRFIGFVPDSDLPDLYRAANIFVMPSTGEEALASSSCKHWPAASALSVATATVPVIHYATAWMDTSYQPMIQKIWCAQLWTQCNKACRQRSIIVPFHASTFST